MGITTVHLILFFVLGGLVVMDVQEDFIMYKGILNGFKNSSNEDNYGVTAFLRENILPIDQISITLYNVFTTLAIALCFSITCGRAYDSYLFQWSSLSTCN